MSTDTIFATREAGIKALLTVFNITKNVGILEQTIYAQSQPFDEADYKRRIYDTVGAYIASQSVKHTHETVKSRNSVWEHVAFDKNRKVLREKDEFLTKPVEIEEGVHTCRKCGNKKTYSVAMQVRSADEGTSVFIYCLKCKHNWREN